MTAAPPRWEPEIRGLFREIDIACMQGQGLDLDDYDVVSSEAELIYEAVAAGRMPTDGPWDRDRVALFRAWIDAGTPR
jgi:hypothetical protein